MFDESVADLNHCCFDEDDGSITRITNPEMMYFSLNGGECRSCNGIP